MKVALLCISAPLREDAFVLDTFVLFTRFMVVNSPRVETPREP